MRIADILVLLDTEASSDARLALAARLAREHDAHLVGACLVDAFAPLFPDPMVGAHGLGTALRDGLVAEYQGAGQVAEGLEMQFRDVLRRDGLQGEWRLLSGTDGTSLARLARITDLVVLGQAGPAEITPGERRPAIEQALFGSGRPVLLVPYIGAPEMFGETVLIGWNHTREAARAVHDALPLLRCARTVTLLSIDAPEAAEGAWGSAEMAAHLARHRVPVTVAETVSAGLAITDVLLDYAVDIGAGMLVAGGYGHSRLHEFAFGGTTLGLLRRMTIPVLLSH